MYAIAWSIHKCSSPESTSYVCPLRRGEHAVPLSSIGENLVPTISLVGTRASTCSFTIPSFTSSSSSLCGFIDSDEKGDQRDCLPVWLEFRSWWTIYFYGASFRNSAKSRPLNCSFIGSKWLQKQRCKVPDTFSKACKPFSFAIVGHMCLLMIGADRL